MLDMNRRPDLSGPPRPYREPDPLGGLEILATLTVLGSVVLAMTGFTMARTRGATRSARLQWEEKKKSIVVEEAGNECGRE